MRAAPAATLAVALCLAVAVVGRAEAQSISPTLGEVRSFTHEFALRVKAENHDRAGALIVMRAYDSRFRPIRASFSHASFRLGAGNSRRVTVVIPFEGARERYVRVCAERLPRRLGAHTIRTRTCGKYRARRF